MPERVSLTREQARRTCVRATGLDHDRPVDAIGVLKHLTSLALDFTEAVVHSHQLVLWSRLGEDLARDDLDTLIGNGQVVELHGRLIAADDLHLYRADLDDWPGRGAVRDWRWAGAEWLRANDRCRRDILDELLRNGPLPAEQLPDTCEVAWRSTGWTNNKNTQRMLDHMEAGGQVAVAGRRGRTRLWDLPERVWPEAEATEPAQARDERNRRRLAAHGLVRSKGDVSPLDPDDQGSYAPLGLEAVVEGVRGSWRLDPDLAEQVDQPLSGRTVVLSPLDPLIFERKRMTEVFGSTTNWRCTNRRPNGAGGTGRCRCSRATS